MSTIALLVSGFALYQTFSTRQMTIAPAPAVVNGSVQAPNSVGAANESTKPPLDTASSPIAVSPATAAPATAAPATATPATAGIQPKQFVQPAFGSIGEVELLSVKRIQDPETGKRDVVNVQFRLRRVTNEDAKVLNDILSAGETVARNPETSETYQAVDPLKRGTSPILIDSIQPNSSVDGYVWMRIPENVTTVDLLLEQTQAFKNVPIAN
ncbi:hypothetical protein IFO70_16585 [Phormidium tenue FACHB-886]|nr:hypothetical protein [Phormidium tenue FACHB-886]